MVTNSPLVSERLTLSSATCSLGVPAKKVMLAFMISSISLHLLSHATQLKVLLEYGYGQSNDDNHRRDNPEHIGGKNA